MRLSWEKIDGFQIDVDRCDARVPMAGHPPDGNFEE